MEGLQEAGEIVFLRIGLQFIYLKISSTVLIFDAYIVTIKITI